MDTNSQDARQKNETLTITVADADTTTTEPPVRHRWLLFKIDVFVLSFVCLQYWINYVDRIGFTNAYVSGMKNDLNLTGSQFTLAGTCFTIGYVVGMLPHNLALLVVPPRIWLSSCTLAWGLLTLGMSHAHSARDLCVLRFFQALFESCTFSGTHLILGAWYCPRELPLRSAIFTSSGLVGAIFSGFMQTAIAHELEGAGGMAGWRWLFIIDFCITVPVALYGLLCFPGMPDATSTGKFTLARHVFSKAELQYARRRLPPQEANSKLSWSVAPRVLRRWHIWVFSLAWILGGENLALASTSTFAIWLQNQDYSLSARNNYPAGIYAVGIVSTLASALYLSRVQRARHWHIAVVLAAVMTIVSALIWWRPLDPNVIFTSQYLGGIAYAGQAVFFAWANVVCHADLPERAIVLASMNMCSGAVNAWWIILFFDASTVPYFRKGCYALLATAIGSAIISIIIRILQIRESKNIANQLSTQISNDSSDDELEGHSDDEITYEIAYQDEHPNRYTKSILKSH
ncbi:hypothetical protein TBLA_0D03000 [Henningerozyma blattae CBS 6284]|uniref:Major facilitator superfamily (MFS) profile domain-containing protein n=1 Tax=Henningerozyma blattae (strain ATCC 34711 / CBS 6284 / DSM 70876 / NBRC 10599 / NRRL Y-10934 / UCD 77-7) TaxID=1071380 RepID=I2H348_HENB6|nr:hypothetical protein TBLA_0D03000 [Tetrapisispora blattae CBS 6284]CCH60800.1 hypothetical protein TBLA_0D03000 [Tetrapisispora blattae CBS 6284]